MIVDTLSQTLRLALLKKNDQDYIYKLEDEILLFLENDSKRKLYLNENLNSYYRLLSHQVADYYHLKHTLIKEENRIIVFKPFGGKDAMPIDKEYDSIDKIRDIPLEIVENSLPAHMLDGLVQSSSTSSFEAHTLEGNDNNHVSNGPSSSNTRSSSPDPRDFESSSSLIEQEERKLVTKYEKYGKAKNDSNDNDYRGRHNTNAYTNTNNNNNNKKHYSYGQNGNRNYYKNKNNNNSNHLQYSQYNYQQPPPPPPQQQQQQQQQQQPYWNGNMMPPMYYYPPYMHDPNMVGYAMGPGGPGALLPPTPYNMAMPSPSSTGISSMYQQPMMAPFPLPLPPPPTPSNMGFQFTPPSSPMALPNGYNTYNNTNSRSGSGSSSSKSKKKKNKMSIEKEDSITSDKNI